MRGVENMKQPSEVPQSSPSVLTGERRAEIERDACSEARHRILDVCSGPTDGGTCSDDDLEIHPEDWCNRCLMEAVLHALDAKTQAERDIERKYRQLLWSGHGHDCLYGDDGEMQCGKCAPTWDYRRAPLEDVERAFFLARVQQMPGFREAALPSGSTPPHKEK